MSTSMRMTKSGIVALDSAMRRAMTPCSRDGSWTTTWPLAGPRSATVPAGPAAPGPRPRGLGLRRLLLLGRLALVGCARRRTLDVRLHDPPARARAVQRAEVDAALAGEAPGDRRRDHALAVIVGPGFGRRLLVLVGLPGLLGLLGLLLVLDRRLLGVL